MKRIKMIIGVILAGCIGLGICVLIKIGPGSSSGDDDDEAAPENVTNIVTVQVAPLKQMTLHRYVTGYGTIEASPATADTPAAGAALAAPTAGVVARVNVVAGQHVNKGDVLVEIDSAAATYHYAKAEIERQEQLYRQQNTSLKNVEDARAQLASLQVVAPVSGAITSLNVTPGQAVDTTTIVAEVVDLDRLAVSMKIPAAQANDLHPDEDVQVQSNPPLTASLSFVSPAVSADDGTVMAWAALPAGSQFKPGQFLPLKITVEVQSNCLAAPAESVVTDDDGNSTVALVNGNEADQTPVKKGVSEDGWVEIQAAGLKAGDRVVTVGAYGLADKTQIQIVSPAQENSAANSSEAQ